MPQAYAQCSLYLHPSKHDFTLEDIPFLISRLQKIGLIAQAINKQNDRDYFTGKKFLDYIAYMGCAPSIQFEANADNENSDNNFCFIKIHSFQSPRLIHSQKQATAPRCPNCKKPVKDWTDNKTDSAINCNQCSTSSNIEAFNWRKMAGYGQLFIEINDIFPKEAMPQQILLDKLSIITNTGWQYFYSCQ